MTDPDDKLRDEIIRRLEAFCAEHGYILSKSGGLIIKDLVRMHNLLGDFYCPCQAENTRKTVCICSAVRNGLVEKEGACFCDLILRPYKAACQGGEMAVTKSVVTPERFTQGLTYEEYVAQVKTNKEQFDRNYQEFQLSEEDREFFSNVNRIKGPVKVVALAEEWCPDVYRGLPVMATIAEAASMEMRVFPRDQNHDIMNEYLNQGVFMSIPVFAFFDEDFNALCHWIERPHEATAFISQV